MYTCIVCNLLHGLVCNMVGYCVQVFSLGEGERKYCAWVQCPAILHTSLCNEVFRTIITYTFVGGRHWGSPVAILHWLMKACLASPQRKMLILVLGCIQYFLDQKTSVCRNFGGFNFCRVLFLSLEHANIIWCWTISVCLYSFVVVGHHRYIF